MHTRTDNQTASPLEAEVAQLIVELLHLDADPAEIDPEAALFNDGLCLDSIDALEISLAVSKAYGVTLRSDDPRNKQIFASLRGLSRFIALNRTT